jgi:hypothetical protein
MIQAIRALAEATQAIKAVTPTIPVSPLFTHTPEVLTARALDRRARTEARRALVAARQFCST